MTKDGLLTVKKNGKVKIIAKTIDGSGVVGEKIVTITGQTLASLSQDKKVVTSSVGDNHQGSLAVDGDVTTRWIANSCLLYTSLIMESKKTLKKLKKSLLYAMLKVYQLKPKLVQLVEKKMVL